MYSLIRAAAFSLTALVAVPAIPADADARPAKGQRHHAKKKVAKKKLHDRRARQGKERRQIRRDPQVDRSLARTRIVLRAALASVEKHESGRAKLASAVVHQRAASIAQRKGKVGAALWLTRQARQTARGAIADNRAQLPAGGGDQPGEFARADRSGIEQFLAQAKKRRPGAKMIRTLAKTRKLVAAAARAAKEAGGEETKGQLRKAMVYQKAARKAAAAGKTEPARHLAKKARAAAQAVLAAHGQRTSASVAGAADLELTKTEVTGAERYVELAEKNVASELDATAVAADAELYGEVGDEMAVELEAIESEEYGDYQGDELIEWDEVAAE